MKKVKLCKEGDNYFVEIPLEILNEIDIDEKGKCKYQMKTANGEETFDCHIIEE